VTGALAAVGERLSRPAVQIVRAGWRDFPGLCDDPASPRRSRPASDDDTEEATPMAQQDTGSTGEDLTPAQLIDARIEELGDWRGTTLATIRGLVHDAIPDVVEEWKWRGVPTWYSGGGIVCTGETYKQRVKVTFFKGAKIDDPSGVFNASLDGNARRAIDLDEGDELDAAAFKALVRAAADLNAG
jgi:hypothetical protein